MRATSAGEPATPEKSAGGGNCGIGGLCGAGCCDHEPVDAPSATPASKAANAVVRIAFETAIFPQPLIETRGFRRETRRTRAVPRYIYGAGRANGCMPTQKFSDPKYSGSRILN